MKQAWLKTLKRLLNKRFRCCIIAFIGRPLKAFFYLIAIRHNDESTLKMAIIDTPITFEVDSHYNQIVAGCTYFNGEGTVIAEPTAIEGKVNGNSGRSALYLSPLDKSNQGIGQTLELISSHQIILPNKTLHLVFEGRDTNNTQLETESSFWWVHYSKRPAREVERNHLTLML